MDDVSAPDAPQADVIVVLGAAVWKRGAASPALKRRVAHAADLYRQGRAGRVLLTGGLGRHPQSEAAVMRELALAGGVDAAHIVLESAATDTRENALYSAVIMKQRGWSSAVVVTDHYHAPRSIMAFRSAGVSAQSAAVPAAGGILHRRYWYHYLRETVALAWYFLRFRLLERGETAAR